MPTPSFPINKIHQASTPVKGDGSPGWLGEGSTATRGAYTARGSGLEAGLAPTVGPGDSQPAKSSRQGLGQVQAGQGELPSLALPFSGGVVAGVGRGAVGAPGRKAYRDGPWGGGGPGGPGVGDRGGVGDGGALTCLIGHKCSPYKKAEKGGGDAKNDRRIRRFYQRFFTGVAVGGRLRFLTLTTSDLALGRDIHRDWRCLLWRMRRRWGRFDYMGVVEHKGGRAHLHMVFKGNFMAQAQVSAMWAEIHASPVVDLRAVKGARGGARYMAKYLAKESGGRYWASWNWVFKGWVGFSQAVRRVTGDWPGRGVLVALARAALGERQGLMYALAGRAYWRFAGAIEPGA